MQKKARIKCIKNDILPNEDILASSISYYKIKINQLYGY